MLYKSEESDERVVTRLMQQNNLQYVFVTRGEKGASLYSEAAVLHRAAAEVEVVDTTGCGDAFTAGVVHSLVNKFDEERMLDYAVELAGKAAGRRGAVP
jgi:sugar/nucleoside kinase (ribokinase family)